MGLWYELLVVRSGKVRPSDFWDLTPNEVGMFLDVFEETVKKDPSKLSDEQRDRLETKAARLRAKGIKML